MVLSLLFVLLSYYALFDGLFGATPGKALMGLRLRRLGIGRLPGLRTAFRRALAGILDLALLTPIWLPLVSSSGRSFADRLTGTEVIHHSGRGSGNGRVWEWVRHPSEADRRRIEVGRAAEEEVARRLRYLETCGYTVFKNIVHPSFGDIDTLAIGPGGVFCVEVKGHAGVVSQEPFSGVLLRDGAPFERDFRTQVARQVSFLTSYLYKDKKKPPVFAFICFTRATISPGIRGVRPQGVATPDELVRKILGAPRILSQRRIEKACARITRLQGKTSGGTVRRGATAREPRHRPRGVA